MNRRALMFRFFPIVLGTLALLITVTLATLKFIGEHKRQSEEALISQWNETERLALAWSEAVQTLANGLADVSESSVAVDILGTEIRHVNGIGEGDAVWQNLLPGTALTVRVGTAGRFEGRVGNGGFLQAKSLGLKSFPTRGEGLVFLRRASDGLIYALSPANDHVVIATLPPALFGKLFPLKDSQTAYALVNSAGPWVSRALSPRAPVGEGQVLYTSDTVGFGQLAFAQPNVKALLVGPSRFELVERARSVTSSFSGMGTAPVAGTNLRLVTRWNKEFLPSRVIEPLGIDLAFVCAAVIFLTCILFMERAKFVASARGLKDSVRAILYQREMPEASAWSLTEGSKQEFRDVLGNVNRVTFAHRALHHWGRTWAAGFDAVDGETKTLFRPVRTAAPSLGFNINVTHDTEWQLHMLASPALEQSLLLVMRNVDFRTDLLRTMLAHGLDPLVRPAKRMKKEAARQAVMEWLERALGLMQEDDPLVWGVFVFGVGKGSDGPQWELAGKAAGKGFELHADREPQRLQWGDELIAEVIPGKVMPFEIEVAASGAPPEADPATEESDEPKPKRTRVPRARAS